MKRASLIGLAVSFILAGETVGWPPSSVEIVPQNPTSLDVIEIALSGDWPDSCVPTASTVLVSGNNIYFDVISDSLLMRPCILVITPWRQSQSVGPLASGTYTVYARHIEQPSRRRPYPLPVADPSLYRLMTEFTVVAPGQTSSYIFASDQSTVIQTGGLAGIHETHSIEGRFQLTVDFDSGTASFDQVDATLSRSSFLPTHNLGELFRMTTMVGTVLRDTTIQFETTALPGGIYGTLTLSFRDDSVQLTGTFTEPWLDAFKYDLNAVAWKEMMLHYVNAAGGDDYNDGLSAETAFATIQKGIDSTKDGGKVLVYPGLYTEEVNFLAKAITVKGVATTAGVPVLESPGNFAVSFYNGEGPDSVLKNFVIRNSYMGIFIAGSSPTIRNVTVVDNQSGIEAYAGSEPDISSSIFWHNTDSDLFQCKARYSYVETGSEGQGNIIGVDPLFVDPANGDYHLLSERGRYWPEHDVWVLDKVTSPCIDGGDPAAVGYSYEPQPNGGRANMGAYGGTPFASMSEMP